MCAIRGHFFVEECEVEEAQFIAPRLASFCKL